MAEYTIEIEVPVLFQFTIQDGFEPAIPLDDDVASVLTMERYGIGPTLTRAEAQEEA